MEIRLFDLTRDEGKIDSFLDAASLAHKNERKTKDWFLWKFFRSPYGPAILVCAFDCERVVGCLGFGRAKAFYNGKSYKAGLSYETFVHPDFQGKGLMKKMLSFFFAHVEAQKMFDLIWNFPNGNSIRGFVKTGWHPIKMPSYYLSIRNPFSVLFYGRDLKKPFVPEISNFECLKKISASIPLVCPKKSNVFFPIWTEEYMKWRFFSHPVARYFVHETEHYWGIARIGYRGRIKEAQILSVVKSNDNARLPLREFCREISKHEKVDCISFCATESCEIFDEKPFSFFKVPSTGNCCFYIPATSSLMEDESVSISGFAFSGIDYHTY